MGTEAFQSISVVIPAYNAERFIAATLDHVQGWLGSSGLEHEVIVVDDGSRDGTARVVRERGRGVVLLSNGTNRGKGYTVRHGMSRAGKAWRLFMDADNSTTIEHLERFAAPASSADVVIASRRLDQSKIVRRQHPIRQALGRSFPSLVRAVALPQYSDTQCGFKLFRAAAADAIFRRATIDRFAFDVELLLLAQQLALKTAEVPVDWDNPTESTLRVRVDTFQMFADLLRMSRKLRPGKQPPPLKCWNESLGEIPGAPRR